MIVETSANQFYQVRETERPGLDHVWYGLSVKRVGGKFVPTAQAVRHPDRPELVRKAGARVVQAHAIWIG